MTGPIVHVGAAITCTHGGPVTVVPGSPRVLVSGMPVATMVDQFIVAGCVFQLVPPTPHPCVLIQWLTPATRVFANGAPVITQTSIGLGLAPDQAPQGPPIVASTQPRVLAQ
ncbi:hypothetical protein Mycsm_06557 (plasmid) [Mycobacterium sp. JS623]|uniref:hypothetical protein n=1 Tax=Mycobacterium sp. JS623 TaxID=212767 RepID=UPI0002A5B4AC|nr:hypothetical protein [Mycobacterium sp. JS623]AGB26694.1 hypothetical protein Mycsm_06557 [Mycobacterium sp. JS623]